MSIKTIIEQLERISDSSWYEINNNVIDLIIDDADDDENNGDFIEEVLYWLEENADYAEGDLYVYYYFNDIVVKVGFTSYYN